MIFFNPSTQHVYICLLSLFKVFAISKNYYERYFYISSVDFYMVSIFGTSTFDTQQKLLIII